MEVKLYRSKKDKIIFGVCGGIAEYFGIDSTIVRIVTVILLMTGSWIAILYLILGIIIPENPKQKTSKPVVKLKNHATSIGLGLLIIGVLLLMDSYNILNWSQIWPILIIILGGYMLWQNQKKK